jgi:hypothetical protein
VECNVDLAELPESGDDFKLRAQKELRGMSRAQGSPYPYPRAT